MKYNEEIVEGLDTIRGLVGEPPKTISIPLDLQRVASIAQSGWNAVHIAMLPFCFKCKEPLTWHTHPQGQILYHCPKCKRQWLKGKDWPKK